MSGVVQLEHARDGAVGGEVCGVVDRPAVGHARKAAEKAVIGVDGIGIGRNVGVRALSRGHVDVVEVAVGGQLGGAAAAQKRNGLGDRVGRHGRVVVIIDGFDRDRRQHRIARQVGGRLHRSAAAEGDVESDEGILGVRALDDESQFGIAVVALADIVVEVCGVDVGERRQLSLALVRFFGVFVIGEQRDGDAGALLDVLRLDPNGDDVAAIARDGEQPARFGRIGALGQSGQSERRGLVVVDDQHVLVGPRSDGDGGIFKVGEEGRAGSIRFGGPIRIRGADVPPSRAIRDDRVRVGEHKVGGRQRRAVEFVLIGEEGVRPAFGGVGVVLLRGRLVESHAVKERDALDMGVGVVFAASAQPQLEIDVRAAELVGLDEQIDRLPCAVRVDVGDEQIGIAVVGAVGQRNRRAALCQSRGADLDGDLVVAVVASEQAHRRRAAVAVRGRLFVVDHQHLGADGAFRDGDVDVGAVVSRNGRGDGTVDDALADIGRRGGRVVAVASARHAGPLGSAVRRGRRGRVVKLAVRDLHRIFGGGVVHGHRVEIGFGERGLALFDVGEVFQLDFVKVGVALSHRAAGLVAVAERQHDGDVLRRDVGRLDIDGVGDPLVVGVDRLERRICAAVDIDIRAARGVAVLDVGVDGEGQLVVRRGRERDGRRRVLVDGRDLVVDHKDVVILCALGLAGRADVAVGVPVVAVRILFDADDAGDQVVRTAGSGVGAA